MYLRPRCNRQTSENHVVPAWDRASEPAKARDGRITWGLWPLKIQQRLQTNAGAAAFPPREVAPGFRWRSSARARDKASRPHIWGVRPRHCRSAQPAKEADPSPQGESSPQNHALDLMAIHLKVGRQTASPTGRMKRAWTRSSLTQTTPQTRPVSQRISSRT